MTHREHNEINRRLEAVESENKALREQVKEQGQLLRAVEERTAELLVRMARAGELDFLDATKAVKP